MTNSDIVKLKQEKQQFSSCEGNSVMIKYIRNLHGSANVFYEKKVDLQQPSTDYRDLLPVDDIQNGNEYLNALSWAFKNKRVKILR